MYFVPSLEPISESSNQHLTRLLIISTGRTTHVPDLLTSLLRYPVSSQHHDARLFFSSPKELLKSALNSQLVALK
jgi:hypothetical protein